MKNLLRPVKFIFSHPLTKNNKILGILNFFIWQIKSRFSKNEIIVNWFGGLKLKVKRGMHGATGCIYVGLPEFEDMSFVLHILRKNDLFLDIGANVGVYSLLASGVKNAKTLAFEPVPSTFNYLTNNISFNKLNHLVTIHNIGLSDKKGYLYFTSDSDTTNHVTSNSGVNTVKIDVETLDNATKNLVDIDTIIKMDVEGFEIKVLEGAIQTLTNKHLIGLIVELNGCSKRYGFEDKDVDEILTKNGFGKYEYNAFDRKLTEIDHFHNEKNTLYLKTSRIVYINEKLASAEPFKIFNKVI